MFSIKGGDWRQEADKKISNMLSYTKQEEIEQVQVKAGSLSTLEE